MVAVVGRPNVGKSTLVNRILGRRETIVEEHPGVTRDRKVLDAEWAGREFTLVDTGGWQAGGMALDKLVSAQAQRAIAEADAVLFVVDATVGPTEQDADVARLLLRSGRPVVLVVNKVDNEARETDIWEFAGLGFRPAVARCRRCTAAAPATCSTRWSAALPPGVDPRGGHHGTGCGHQGSRRPEVTRGRTRAGRRDLRGPGRRRGADRGGHRGEAQCG